MNHEEHAQYNIAHFKKLASKYHLIEFFVGKLRKIVAKKFGKTPLKILDVACGPGPQTLELAKAGHSVIGIDLSPDMLAKAKKDPSLDLKYIEGDATKTPFADSEFDASTISFALHDMPENIAVDVLKEMKRVTKNGGQIIIVDYNQPSNFLTKFFLGVSKHWETRYYPHFIQKGLMYYLTQAGLEAKNRSVHLLGSLQLLEMVNKK